MNTRPRTLRSPVPAGILVGLVGSACGAGAVTASPHATGPDGGVSVATEDGSVARDDASSSGVSEDASVDGSVGISTGTSGDANGSPPPGVASGSYTPAIASGFAGSSDIYYTRMYADASAPGLVIHNDPSTNAAITLASGQPAPVAITIDSLHVYWTNALAGEGTVLSVPLGGGPIATIASGQDVPNSIAVSNGTLYWTDKGADPSVASGSLVSSGLLGEGLVTMASGLAAPASVILQNGRVYWTEYRPTVASDPETGTGGVFSILLDGGGGPTLASTAMPPGRPTGLAVDSNKAYWTATYGDTEAPIAAAGYGFVASVTLDGGTVTTLAANQPMPSSVGIDGRAVYWTTWGDAGILNGGALQCLTFDGGVLSTLVPWLERPVSLVVQIPLILGPPGVSGMQSLFYWGDTVGGDMAGGAIGSSELQYP